MADIMSPDKDKPNGDKTSIPERSSLDQRLDNGIPEHLQTELGPSSAEKLNSLFQDNANAIRMLWTDSGIDGKEIETYLKGIPNPNNLKDPDKQKVLDELQEERAHLAVNNFPIYISILSELDPDKKDLIDQFTYDFNASNTELASKAEISETTRLEVVRGINAKTIYYSEMIKTMLIEGGMSAYEAEEIALGKSIEIIDADSIQEKTKKFIAFKEEALGILLSTLDRSLLVWDELFPGKAEEEEMNILGQDEKTRNKRAKDLYKRTVLELDRRRSDYKLRLTKHLKENFGNSSYEAYHQSNLSEAKLINLPRIEQIRIMSSGQFL